MSITAQKMQAELARLSDADRAELANWLIQSLHPQSDDDAGREWDLELDKRRQQIEDGSARGEPADKVFSELRAKFS